MSGNSARDEGGQPLLAGDSIYVTEFVTSQSILSILEIALSKHLL
jgi:hypothetical protein